MAIDHLKRSKPQVEWAEDAAKARAICEAAMCVGAYGSRPWMSEGCVGSAARGSISVRRYDGKSFPYGEAAV